MSVLPVGFGSSGGVDTGDIGHSLRFRGTQYIATTLTTAATSTYFILFKQAKLGAINPLFDTNIKINANDTITAFGLTTTAVKRDPTGWHWMHVSNNGLVVDGVNLGAVTTSAITNPRIGYDGTNYANMYGARICCVSGSSLAYTDFVTFNTTTNEWVVKTKSAIKALVDAGGSAGFMYDFEDATSLTTLGNDHSAKNNDGTLTGGFSLTAGTTYDHMLDVPGNSYAVLNPLDTGANTLSNGNLTCSTPSVQFPTTRASMGMSSGKWYWETVASSFSGGNSFEVGIQTAAASLSTYVSNGPFGWSYSAVNGNKITNNVGVAYGAAYAANDVIGAAFDADAGTLTFYKNGVSQGQAFSGLLAGQYFPAFGDSGSSQSAVAQINFGQRPFAYTPPTGFKALCQANLPTPAILNPEVHMDVVTVTKSGNTNFTIPWDASTYDTFFEIKRRDAAGDWYQIDGLRGYDKILKSNSTAAETTDANVLGISGTTGTLKSTLADGTYVITMHKAGLTASRQTNTDGSITSTVSRNVDSGFAIVTYTGTGANATVGHGLGVEPKMLVARNRNSGAAVDWDIYHDAIGNTYRLQFNTSAKIGPAATAWNNTSPTSSVFSLGTGQNVNESGKNLIAYCHADIPGYSKAFSYTGNGSADGPYVDLWFKPRWILYKNATTGATGWIVFDSARDPYNAVGQYLQPNTAGAEGTSATLDLTSSGFKLRATSTDTNQNGATYIGFAIADVAGKYSLGR